MTKQKRISVPEPHHRYAKDRDISLSEVARERLNDLMKSEKECQTYQGARYTGNSDVKHTSVSIAPEQAAFVDEVGLNLSALIRTGIDEQLEEDRKLQKIEDSPGNLLSSSENAMISIIPKAHRADWTDRTYPIELIRWYRTGEMPPQEQVVDA